MGVNWSMYNYLSEGKVDYGALLNGDTRMRQVLGSINGLVYQWYNNGSVFDNTSRLNIDSNDISSYANWLDTYCPEVRNILTDIEDIRTTDQYEELLWKAATVIYTEEMADKYSKLPMTEDTVLDCKGRYEINNDDAVSVREFDEDTNRSIFFLDHPNVTSLFSVVLNDDVGAYEIQINDDNERLLTPALAEELGVSLDDYRDDIATALAQKCGYKTIPANELPKSFSHNYDGWLDTPANRKIIEEVAREVKNKDKGEER